MLSIEERNFCIAVFMGKSFNGSHITDYDKNKIPRYVSERIKYHKDWRMLMPVVEKIKKMVIEDILVSGKEKAKIENITWSTSYCNTEMNTQYDAIGHALLKVDILALHSAVIQFIQYHNSYINK